MKEASLNHYRLIIFNADGTLRRCTVPDQPCPNKPGEWELMPNVKRVIHTLFLDSHKTLRFGIASNQAGIALGYLSEPMARQLLTDLVIAVSPSLWRASFLVQFCPHRIEENCTCRKPQPGMLLTIMESARVSPKETLFVGDQESDREAACNAECNFETAARFFGWE